MWEMMSPDAVATIDESSARWIGVGCIGEGWFTLESYFTKVSVVPESTLKSSLELMAALQP